MAVFYLWVMPDTDRSSDRTIRWLFFVMLVANICVPDYYALQISGLPWISIRRLTLFPLVVVFAVSISSQPAVRLRVRTILVENAAVALGVGAFLLSIWASLATSINVSTTTSQAVDAIFAWFIPMLTAVYVVRSDEDVHKVVRIICVCAVFICAIGISEFLLESRLAVELMPTAMLEQMMRDNDSIARMVTSSPYREGVWRSASVYGVSLCFGEFSGMVTPLGIYLLVHRRSTWEKFLGSAVILLGVVGVYASGSRGAYMTVGAGAGVFAMLWYFRQRVINPRAVKTEIIVVIMVLAAITADCAVLFWGKARNLVLGGGMASYSTDARYEQWYLGIPKIISSPLIGHGFGLGGLIIENGNSGGYTIDSYVLSLLVETGVLGFVGFCLAFFAAIFVAARRYIRDVSEGAAVQGALASMLAGFMVYRLVLSQRENHKVAFVACGMIMASQVAHRATEVAKRRRAAVDNGGVASRYG
jgi:O-antigen ligase